MAHSTVDIAKAIVDKVKSPVTKEALMEVMGVSSNDKFKEIIRKLAVCRSDCGAVVIVSADDKYSVDTKVSAQVTKAMTALNKVQPLGTFGGGGQDKTKTKAHAKKLERAAKLRAQLAALDSDIIADGGTVPGKDAKDETPTS